MMLHNRMCTDTDVDANLVEFTNHDSVAGLEASADDIAGINDRMGTYMSPSADLRFEIAWSIPTWCYSNDDKFIHLCIAQIDPFVHYRTSGDTSDHKLNLTCVVAPLK